MSTLISIITPTYNRKTLLRKAILSVVNQKSDIPFTWELIIIDDGSTDGTHEHIADLLELYKENISYFFQENAGVGKARNIGLEKMSKNSDYLMLLDSDDEIISDCINYFLHKVSTEESSVAGWYFLCQDENGRIIGDKKILENVTKQDFNYERFLRGDINIEMGIMVVSSLFLDKPQLRFPEDIITESVMWAKMWQFLEKEGQVIRLYDYIGRLYRTNHTEAPRITKTISEDRFRKNAIGNDRVLQVIGVDLLKRGYNKSYADILFRSGINWILGKDPIQGRANIWKAGKISRNPLYTAIFFLSFFGRYPLLVLYKLYV